MAAPLVRKAGLLDDETGLHVIPLSVLLLDALGPGYLNWTSEALQAECEDRWGSLGVLTWERIQAARILQLHNAFWSDWEVFEKITAAIVGEAPIFSLVQPPEAEEIAIALSVANRVDNTRTYDNDVRSYIAACCLNDGFWYLESPIKEVAEAEIAEFDERRGINREYGMVAEELKKSDKLQDDMGDPVIAQANRVRGVRSILRQYEAEVDRQLKQLRSKPKA